MIALESFLKFLGGVSEKGTKNNHFESRKSIEVHQLHYQLNQVRDNKLFTKVCTYSSTTYFSTLKKLIPVQFVAYYIPEQHCSQKPETKTA